MKMRSQMIIFTFIASFLPVNYSRIVYKSEWQQDAKQVIPRRSYTSSYVVLFQTGGSPCFQRNSCINRVQSIQNYYLEKWNELIFNFLIGGNGDAYEGSGFYGRNRFLGPQKNNYFLIAFIGNFTDIQTSSKAWESLEDFLNFAKDLRFLAKDYTLLSFRQVKYNDQCVDHNSKYTPFKELSFHPHWKNITLTIDSIFM